VSFSFTMDEEGDQPAILDGATLNGETGHSSKVDFNVAYPDDPGTAVKILPGDLLYFDKGAKLPLGVGMLEYALGRSKSGQCPRCSRSGLCSASVEPFVTAYRRRSVETNLVPPDTCPYVCRGL
jgi:hypothetical protein